MNLYFIRHGEKEAYFGDADAIKLTDKGHRQADLAGKRLKSKNIDMIFSSTMVRAKQTTEEINKYLSVDVAYRDALKEINMGDCDVSGWDNVNINDPEFVKEFEKHEQDIAYPNGESGGDVWRRVQPVIHEIVQLNHENIAIVTHGGVIRCMICGALGLPQYKRFSFGAPIEHCSITCIEYLNGQFILHAFNDYNHLGNEL